METQLYRITGNGSDYLSEYADCDEEHTSEYCPHPPALLIAYYLDDELESANYHSMVGIHKKLLDMLHTHFDAVPQSEDRIQAFFEYLVDRGGLLNR